MRFQLALQALENKAFLPFNYQYPLSAAIYKIIERADKLFAQFLHDHGYTAGSKQFKLFTFSDIRTLFDRSGDRMLLRTGVAELIICFYMPQAAETFIRGLFMHQQIEIADAKSKVTFAITGIESQSEMTGNRKTVMLQPLSPLVAGRKNDRGHYDYYNPEEAPFADCLKYNLFEKWGTVHDASDHDISSLQHEVTIAVQFFRQPPQQRLITIKAGTPAETRIRGYTKFRLAVNAPASLLALAMGAGLGLHNAQGFGCVEIV